MFRKMALNVSGSNIIDFALETGRVEERRWAEHFLGHTATAAMSVRALLELLLEWRLLRPL